MYWSTHDEAEHSAVWVMDGPTVTPEEWDRHFADIVQVAEWGRSGGKQPAVILFIGHLFLPPDALRRKQLAEATSAPGYNCLLGIVSPNLVLRSVMTAIKWVRGSTPSGHENEFFRDAVAARQWLEGKRDASLPAFRAMLRRAPAEAVRGLLG